MFKAKLYVATPKSEYKFVTYKNAVIGNKATISELKMVYLIF